MNINSGGLSYMTGSAIYSKIAQIKTEISEIKGALSEIQESIGSDSYAHKILKKELKDKDQTLHNLLGEKYVYAPKINPSIDDLWTSTSIKTTSVDTSGKSPLDNQSYFENDNNDK
jgi:aldehyde:ferredoxin oxidoreductase